MSVIAVDFDGTCVTHMYPMIGTDIGAVPVLQALTENGHKLILNTMRSGATLEQAKQWFEYHQIPLWAANTNPQQKHWTQSPKVYAHLYIDDAALGCPLVQPESERPYVNWVLVARYLKENKYISQEQYNTIVERYEM